MSKAKSEASELNDLLYFWLYRTATRGSRYGKTGRTYKFADVRRPASISQDSCHDQMETNILMPTGENPVCNQKYNVRGNLHE